MISPTVTANLIRIVTKLERQRDEAIAHERTPEGSRQIANIRAKFGCTGARSLSIDEADVVYLRAAMTALAKAGRS